MQMNMKNIEKAALASLKTKKQLKVYLNTLRFTFSFLPRNSYFLNILIVNNAQ